ncbi:hypothetical protein ABG067_004559 [Albugo candida]|uniref:BRCT domain-containing protein n=1 Tax=Albugo candida TaxID=65357 RepID=A0A024GDS4_9STRA|nr:unnamed protein product [Albugo candida]|eukprot:CCI45021.1 unnamed protein product [Albugo candida]
MKFAQITHVIGSNLNGSKTHKLIQYGSNIHYIRADWILESVRKMVRQQEIGYTMQSLSKEATLLSSYVYTSKDK